MMILARNIQIKASLVDGKIQESKETIEKLEVNRKRQSEDIESAQSCGKGIVNLQKKLKKTEGDILAEQKKVNGMLNDGSGQFMPSVDEEAQVR